MTDKYDKPEKKVEAAPAPVVKSGSQPSAASTPPKSPPIVAESPVLVPPAPHVPDLAASAIAEASAVVRRFDPAPSLDPERERDRLRLRDALAGRRLADLTDAHLADAAGAFRSQALIHARAHGVGMLRTHAEALIAGLPAPTT